MALAFVGCDKNETQTPTTAQPQEGQNSEKPVSNFDAENDITVVARDAASGTRGAFHELMK